MIINVLSYFKASAERFPERIAFSDRNTRLTYREAWDSISALGRNLHEALGTENRPVAVSIRHTVQDLLGFFAVVYSGNYYIPLDLTLPRERVERMLAVTEPEAVLLMEPARSTDALGARRTLTPDQLRGNPAQCEPWTGRKDTDLLYVIFTSGSTGEPKGVSVSHRSVIDMAEQFQRVFRFPEGTVFGNQAPFDFDVSVKDIFLALKTGGTVEILEKKLFSFPKLLMERIIERRIDTLIWAVPALKIVAELNTFESVKPEGLKNVLFSGEVLPPKTLQYWQRHLPGVRFVNLYGPTEITCNCTYHIVAPGAAPEAAIPIGTAFPNCEVFLLDGDAAVTEDGQIGEICVTGSCLAMGYYRRPALTAEAFVPNPRCEAFPERMYRTGDLGFLRQGVLYYAGRKDTQIKHMGHRIELGEIELCANAAEGVAVSACVYDAEALRLVLFYQGEAEEKALAAALRSKLPKYMLPAQLRRVSAFPMTRTGKIDRKELKAIVTGEMHHG